MDVKKQLRYFYLNGIFAFAQDTISSGTILIYFAALLGASDSYIGLIVSIPFFANLMSLLSGYFADKGIPLKKISIVSSCISKPMYILIAMIPFIQNKQTCLIALFLSVFFLYFSGSVTGGAFNIWMKTIIPPKISGKILSKRFKYMMLTQLFCYLFTYLLLKYIKSEFSDMEIQTYRILFIFAFILGIMLIWTLFMLKETKVSYKKENFLRKIKSSFKNPSFRTLAFNLGSIHFLLKFTFPLTMVFLIKTLGFSLDKILILTLFYQISFILTSDYSGKIADELKFFDSSKKAFYIFFIFALGFFGIAYLNIKEGPLLYFILIFLQILQGSVMAFFQVIINNAILNYTDEHRMNIEIPVLHVSNSVSQGLGASFGGVFISFCLLLEKTLNFGNKNGFSILFIFSLVLSIILFYNCSKFNKRSAL